MKLNKIRELEIAKLPFDISQKCFESLNYKDWVSYIEMHGFIWKEDTEAGKKTLESLDAIPNSFRDRVLLSLNKRTACFDLDEEKNQYRILFTFRSEFNYVGINIEGKLSVKDIKMFASMATHLDALLLKDGMDIIDEKVIEGLEHKF